jgi:hypothetical protein
MKTINLWKWFIYKVLWRPQQRQRAKLRIVAKNDISWFKVEINLKHFNGANNTVYQTTPHA